jgi:Ca2+-transporting ATPase
VFPALALGIGRGHGHELERPPRDPEEPILTNYHWSMIGGYGVVIAITILLSFFLAQDVLGMNADQAVTISFLTLSVSRLFHALNMRDRTTTFFKNEIVNNPWIWGAMVLSFGLLVVAINVPILAEVLQLVHPGLNGWFFVIGMSLIPLVVGQIWKVIEDKLIFTQEN